MIESHEACKSENSERLLMLQSAAGRSDTGPQLGSLKGGLIATVYRNGPTVLPVQVPVESLHDMVPSGAGTPQWNHKVIYGFVDGKWDDMGSCTTTKVFSNGKWFKPVPSMPIDSVPLSASASRNTKLYCCTAPNGNTWLDTGIVSPFH